MSLGVKLFPFPLTLHVGLTTVHSGVGVRLKVGGVNIEKIEGVGSGEGLCLPQLGVWGLAVIKKILR